ncbi:MAG: hypothetical protein U0175_31260 [Caldilineaceae bacterium]
MSFGSSPDTVGTIIIFGLGLLLSLPIVALVTRLLQWVLRIKNGWFTLLAIVLVYVGGLVGTSLYLDSAGIPITAKVIEKKEMIRYRKEGDWQEEFRIQVSYPGSNGAETTSGFRTDARYFDSLHQGQQVTVRRLSINGWFDITRFADQSTWTWIPWRWIGWGLGVIGLGWLGWKSLRNRMGCLLLSVLCVVLFCVPFALKYVDWRNAEDPSRTPLQATGTVEEVHRVTTVDPLPSDHGDGEWETKINVAQLYDIVVVRYTPQGYKESILGVDAIDVETIGLKTGDQVEFSYAADQPRAVRLAKQTRFHYIRNPLEWLKQQMFAVALIVLLLLGVNMIGNNLPRWLNKKLTS